MANILKKFKNNFEDITEYYNYLVTKTKNHEQVDITNEWLIDNYYLLAEHKNNIYSQKGSLKKKEISKIKITFLVEKRRKRDLNPRAA